MLFKKTLALALVLSQASVAFAAGANVGVATAQATPETTLITTVIALSGEKLSQTEAQQQLTSALNEYDATAPEAGRVERIEQAMVDLNIYTPAQMTVIDSQLQAAATQFAGEKFASQQDQENAFEAKLVTLIPMANGAQFSGCDAAMLTLGVVSGAALVGSTIWFEKATTLSSEVLSSVTWTVAFAVFAPWLLFGGWAGCGE